MKKKKNRYLAGISMLEKTLWKLICHAMYFNSDFLNEEMNGIEIAAPQTTYWWKKRRAVSQKLGVCLTEPASH